jgi:hypothetical protein
MRRSILALAGILVLALALAPPAWAIGTGGWDHVGHGSTLTTPALNANVTALNTDNPGVLYVGGNFTNAGGHVNADRIARWDGTAWSVIGGVPLTNGQVFAIAYHAGKVYVGGTFLNAGDHANADFLAAWDTSTSTWSSPCTSTKPGAAITANVNALQIVNDTLYVGGSFQNGAAIESADYLVACDLTTGVATSTVSSDGGMSGEVLALTADSNGTLYAGGGFNNVDTIQAADHVAAYDHVLGWFAMGGTPLDPAVHGTVRSLTAHGTDVYVGTDSVNVDNIARADHIARWDGAAWNAMGADSAGTNGWFATASAYTIDALDTYGSVVVAAGSFQNANGIATADGVAYFDGSHWRPIGSDGAGNGPFGSAHPTAVGIVQGKVFVGGNMTSAGGDSLAKYLAAYTLRRPDLGISPTSDAGPVEGYVNGPYLGSNKYSSTGVGEVRTVTVTRGQTVRCYIRVQNDGLVPAPFKIKGTGGATGITAHYYRDGQYLAYNITADIRDGSYVTDTIDPGASVRIRLEVHVANSSATKATITTTGRSQSGTPADAVKLVVKATG